MNDALRTAAQMALEALETSHVFLRIEVNRSVRNDCTDATIREAEELERNHAEVITALRTALATGKDCLQVEPDLSRCPKCNGPADNGHDRCILPTPYWYMGLG